MTRGETPCPQCGKPAARDPGNAWRPFCSERCKLADLGQWFSERYAIPDDPPEAPPPPGKSTPQ